MDFESHPKRRWGKTINFVFGNNLSSFPFFPCAGLGWAGLGLAADATKACARAAWAAINTAVPCLELKEATNLEACIESENCIKLISNDPKQQAGCPAPVLTSPTFPMFLCLQPATGGALSGRRRIPRTSSCPTAVSTPTMFPLPVPAFICSQ